MSEELSHCDTVEVVFCPYDEHTNKLVQHKDNVGFFISKDQKHILVKGFLLKAKVHENLIMRMKLLCKLDRHRLHQISFNDSERIQTTRLVLLEKIINKSKIKVIG